jgi:hypothetical protein
MFSEENGLVGREQGEWGGCLDWIGSVPIPALLVSVDLRIRAYNTLAARLLVRRDLIRANAGYLSCSADSATVQLHKAVARVGGRQCVAEAFPINPESPASAGIIVVRDAKTYYGTPVVLVLAAERKTLHGPGPDPKLLRQAFGFTPTEARLASHLAQGRTLADCACLLTVTEQSASLSTVVVPKDADWPADGTRPSASPRKLLLASSFAADRSGCPLPRLGTGF